VPTIPRGRRSWASSPWSLDGVVGPSPADTRDMTARRPLRMLGAILVLLAGLATLWLGVEIVMDRYRPLMEYGNHTTAYG